MLDYDIRHGRTYMYFKGEPLYPFGYGLSYTTFAYSNLRANSGTVSGNNAVTVSVDVKNTGSRAGDEVVQLYVTHLNSALARPLKELKGFRRVQVKPGETITVSLPLTAPALSYWNAAKHAFVVEPGKVEIMVGASSADLRLRRTIAVKP
jgi:beta-glucosidase